MGFFAKKKEITKKTFAVFDVSSWRVGGHIIEIITGRRPRILWSTTKKIPLTLRPENMRDAVLDQVHACARLLIQSGVGPIDESVCFIGEPFAQGEFRTITLEKKKPFVVTEKILTTLLEEDFEDLQKEMQKKIHSHEEFSLLDRKTNWVAVNGHRIGSYIGKTVERVDIGTYWSIVSKEFTGELSKTLSRVFKRMPIACHSLLYATLSGAQALSPHASYAVISLGGVSTTLSIITNEGFCSNIIVPVGARSFLSEIGSAYGLTGYREILSLFRLYYGNMLSSQDERRIAGVLRKSSATWVRGIESAWGEAFAVGHIPGICLYQGDEVLLPIVQESLAKSAYLKTHTLDARKVLSFDATLLPGHVIFETKTADGIGGILALFLGQLHSTL